VPVARLERVYWALPALAVIAVYARSWGHSFAWDDAYLIVGNPSVHGFDHALSWFAEPWAAGATSGDGRAQNALYWRPLTQASFALDWVMGGGHPWPFHLTNTLLHALSASAVAVGARAVGRRLAPSVGVLAAIFAGLLWAVHPVHGEAVNLATYRSSLLAGAATLWGAALWQRGGLSRYWVVPALYAAGLCAKEEAAVLPGLLVVLELTVLRSGGDIPNAVSPQPSHRRRAPWTLACMVVLLAAWWWVRKRVTGAPVLDFFAAASASETVATMMKVYLLDLRLLVWPWPLTPFYDWTLFPVATTWVDSEVLGGALALLFTAALALAGALGRLPALGAISGWFLLALLPYSHILPFFDVAAERFLYVPSAAVAVGVALGAVRLGRKAALGALAVTMVFASLSWTRVPHFANTSMLLQETARRFPHSFSAHFELGRVRSEQGEHAEAVAAFQAAHALLPGLEAAGMGLLQGLQRAGRGAEAGEFARAELEAHARDISSEYRRMLEAAALANPPKGAR
jgi:hypothetical protein